MKSSAARTVQLVESVVVNPEVRHLVFEATGGRTSGVDVYLCGHAAMVWEIRHSLDQSGFDIAPSFTKNTVRLRVGHELLAGTRAERHPGRFS